MTNPWEETRILVVGGAGFVGSNLSEKLLRSGAASIVLVDNLLSAERENIPMAPILSFWEGSIADDRVLNRVKDDFDYIFHLATFHGNQSSIRDPMADHENNLLTTLKLLNHVRDFRRVRKVVYSGAGCAVAKRTSGDAEATSEDGNISLDMDSPYSISKIVGEFYAVYFHKQHGLPTVRARFQNVYGPREILGAGKWRGTPATVWRNVTPTFIYKALKGQALPVENQGVATRDFIYVEDVVAGLMSCALNGQGGEVYNIASGVETSIMELAQIINQLTGNATFVQQVPKRDWDTSGRRFGSTDKARRELGFEAKVRLREGLSRTIEWTRSALPLIEGCMKKHVKHMAPYA